MNKKHNDDGISWCECICHQVGKNVRHFMLCCDLCYEKYIDENGVNQALLDIAKKEFLAKKKRNEPKKSTKGRDQHNEWK